MGGCQVPGKDGPNAPVPAWKSPLPPVPSAWGWQLCPCPLLAAHRHQPAPHTHSLPSGVWPRGLFSRLPSLLEPRVPTTEAQPSWALAAGWHRGSLGSTQPSAPSKPGTGRLLAGRQGSPGRKGRVQGAPNLGAESAPTLPSIPLCSLQLAEYSSRVDEYLQQCLLYLQSPQASMRVAAIRFLGEPQLPRGPSLPHRSLAPALAAAPAAGIGPVAVEPRLPDAGPGHPRGSLPPSPTPALGHHALGAPQAQPCQGEECCWGQQDL